MRFEKVIKTPFNCANFRALAQPTARSESRRGIHSPRPRSVAFRTTATVRCSFGVLNSNALAPGNPAIPEHSWVLYTDIYARAQTGKVRRERNLVRAAHI
jgi:hypothetical protein